MYEWNEPIQKMIDWIEQNINENLTLIDMSKQIGYSPYYCSRQFHKIAGMTLKSYIAKRRLCNATFEIRDTNNRLLDIALKNGFSSHEALTRAFVNNEYGCTPNSYRNNPKPMAVPIRKVVYLTEHYGYKGDENMSETCLTNANIRVEFIPAHKYLGIWNIDYKGYWNFCGRDDFDDICGLIDSMSNKSHPIITCHTAGWYHENSKKGYFYGLGVPFDYDGEIPEGFEIKEFPESYYLCFFHPKFDYIKDNGKVMGMVEDLAWNFDPSIKGYEWNEEICQDYQRHYPEVLGYEVLRPIIIK